MTDNMPKTNEITTQKISANERVIRFPELRERIGLSRSHIHSLVAKNRFPAPIKLGDRASGFLESQVNAWLEQRIAESQSKNNNAA